MLVLIGFVPKIGAFTTIIPSSVLGGAMVAMFGMVVASGIKMLSKVEFTLRKLINYCLFGRFRLRSYSSSRYFCQCSGCFESYNWKWNCSGEFISYYFKYYF